MTTELTYDSHNSGAISNFLCEWLRASMTLNFTPIQRRYRERNRYFVTTSFGRHGRTALEQ